MLLGPKLMVSIMYHAHHTLLPSMYHYNRGRLSAHHTLLPNMYHDNRGRLSAQHTLLPNMYHDNRGRLSAHHTLLPNMYHDNRGRLSAHNTLPPNMYHDNRGWLSAHHTLPPNMYHDNRGRLSAHHTLLSNMYHDNRCLIFIFSYRMLTPWRNQTAVRRVCLVKAVRKATTEDLKQRFTHKRFMHKVTLNTPRYKKCNINRTEYSLKWQELDIKWQY